jgi:hypothetical protein
LSRLLACLLTKLRIFSRKNVAGSFAYDVLMLLLNIQAMLCLLRDLLNKSIKIQLELAQELQHRRSNGNLHFEQIYLCIIKSFGSAVHHQPSLSCSPQLVQSSELALPETPDPEPFLTAWKKLSIKTQCREGQRMVPDSFDPTRWPHCWALAEREQRARCEGQRAQTVIRRNRRHFPCRGGHRWKRRAAKSTNRCQNQSRRSSPLENWQEVFADPVQQSPSAPSHSQQQWLRQ